MSGSPEAAMKAQMAAPWAELAAIVGSDHLRAATPADAVDGVPAQMVIQPASADELARALRVANAAGLSVIPRGGGTKLGWGNPPRRADLILSTAPLDSVRERAGETMTATVQAGCTVEHFQRTLAEHRQRLALDALWPKRATIGGMLAANDSGALRVRFGALRDLIIGITLALPDGTLAKSGGKVVKNVAGYDLPKLATGSLGTLGIITQAIFRLHPVPPESRTLTFLTQSFSGLDTANMNALVLAIQDSKLVPTGVQVRAGSSSLPEVDIRFEGTAAGCDAQTEQALRIAFGARRIESPADVWNARETLWSGAEPSVVCKFSLLPSNLGALCDELSAVSERLHLSWRLVAQAAGGGLLRLGGANGTVLFDALSDLRGKL